MRCPWANGSLELQRYHDTEWCKVSHDDTYLFEMLILEGFQAGLSWQLVLQRREGMAKALHQFNWQKLMHLSDDDLANLLHVDAMIKNKLKINAIRSNAIAFEKVRQEFGTFDTYIWQFTDGKVVDNHLNINDSLPAQNELSQIVSKDLKKRGFKFVGSTIIYSYLQAIGIINDHIDSCPFK